MSPDSVTIYQMELPYNTVIPRDERAGRSLAGGRLADKRRWVERGLRHARRRRLHGVQRARTGEGPAAQEQFVYRDNLWRGADLLATGVASFGHFSGVHYQNVDQLEDI